MDLMLGDTKFSIKEENIENVIKAFKKTYSKNANINVEDINSIEDVFWEFGYNVFTDEDGNITDIDNDSSNLPGGQKKFFSSIAKYIERESYRSAQVLHKAAEIRSRLQRNNNGNAVRLQCRY